jgi:hypothetical protein
VTGVSQGQAPPQHHPLHACLRDGAEHIGTVESFADGVLTIKLAGAVASSGGDDDDHGGDRDRTCPAGALAAGVQVEEAELQLLASGPWFEEIELRN